jgi:tetratricopeptide (TPR) repeat protein
VLDRVAGFEPDEIAAALQRLVENDFLYESALYPHPEYAFKHPLTQEVAYGSLLGERRRQVHALVAQALNDIDPERLDEHAALISLHWESAGHFLSAARWSRRAADWVVVRNRTEAVGHWRRVLAMLARLPESDDALELGLPARAGLLTSGFLTGLVSEDEADILYEEGLRIAERTGDLRALAVLESGYGGAKAGAGKPTEGLERRARAVAIADRTDDVGLRASLRVGLTLALNGAGRPRESLAVADEVIELIGDDMHAGRSVTGTRPALRVMMTRSMALIELGRLDDAARQLDEMERTARELQELEDLGLALMGRFFHAYRLGEIDLALSRALQAFELTERNATAFFRMLAHTILGNVYVELGRWADARNAAEGAIDLIAQSHLGLTNEPPNLANLALAHLHLGDAGAALEIAQRAVAMAVERGAKGPEYRTRQALGQIMLESEGAAAADDVEREFQLALDIVREIGHKAHEPLIHLDLAKLARVRGDDTAHAQELRQALGLFREMGMDRRAEQVELEML